jgi:hypothetical protein
MRNAKIVLGVICFVVVIILLNKAGHSMQSDHSERVQAASVSALADAPQAADEAAALIIACGKPKLDSQKVSPSEVGAMNRTVKYARVEFSFMKDQKDAWTMTGAFWPHGDDALTVAQVAPVMPCAQKVHFSNSYF